jgi:hypothetical protein
MESSMGSERLPGPEPPEGSLRRASDPKSLPPPLCAHDRPLESRDGFRAACPVCGSFWDLDALQSKPEYDRDYPSLRCHHEADVGRLKVASLVSWLEATGISVDGLTVCEIGFGGGHCLHHMRRLAARVFGVDAVPENLSHAERLGLEPGDLFAAGEVPPLLPAPVDLWLFLDSFEHVEQPGSLLDWLAANSTGDARILLVAPEAGSTSQRLLGRFWPHKLRDHQFHWSRQGVIEFFGGRGFAFEATFSPVKHVSTRTLIPHLVHKLGLAGVWRESWTAALPSWSLRFNVGEMGILFRKRPRP